MLSIKNNLFKANSDDSIKKGEAILGGAVIGAGVGAVGGAIYGYNQAQNEIQKVPIESVTLTYKEPMYETKEIGKIPKDQYVRTWFGWYSSNVDFTPSDPVYEKVPVKDANGNVVYKEVTKTFTDHGKPIVNYYTQQVKEPVFQGYSQIVITDYDYDCYYHEHYDGTMHEHCKEEVRGYWVRVYPKVDYKIIDTYQVPTVEFEHGVDVAGKVMTGMAIGAGLGAVLGGVIGAVVHSISQMEKSKNENNK